AGREFGARRLHALDDARHQHDQSLALQVAAVRFCARHRADFGPGRAAAGAGINPSVPAKNVAEFIDYARANPGKLSVASFGARTISHLAIELIKSHTGIDVLHVPYHGGAPMLTAMITGRIQAGVDALPNSLPHIRSGA